MEKTRCYILCAGPAEGAIPRPGPADFIIACDGGMHVAVREGISVDLFVSDHDSYRGPAPEGVESIEVAPEKDDTDSMLAIKIGLDRGYRDFVLVNALGGRIDHTLANLQALAFLLDRGARAAATGCGDWVCLIEDGRIELTGWPDRVVSIFAVDGPAEGVCTEGLYYPLDHAVISSGFPLGISNRFLGERAAYSVKKGRLLVVLPREEEPV